MDTLAFEHLIANNETFRPKESRGNKAMDMISQLMSQGMNLAMIYHLMKKEGSSLTKKATEMAMDKIEGAKKQVSELKESGEGMMQQAIDGGRSQLEQAEQELKELNTPNVERIMPVTSEQFDDYPGGFQMTSDPVEQFPKQVQQPEAFEEIPELFF